MLRLFGDRTSLLAALASHWADGQLQLPSGSAAQTWPSAAQRGQWARTFSTHSSSRKP